jgi:hypothetical protein
MTNGDTYRIRRLPEDDALELVSDFGGMPDPESPTLTLVLDTPWWKPGARDTIIHLARAHVSSIELA